MITTEQEPHIFLPAMCEAAREGGGILKSFYSRRESLQVNFKSRSDFVSEADVGSERCIHQLLKKAWPDFGALLEEAGEVEGADSRYQWIVDPLDGTTNFLNGIPHFSVSIGLAFEGQPVAGVVYQPLTDELFTAASGHGAWLNDQRLACSSRTDLRQMLLGTGLPFGEKTRERFEAFAAELIGPMRECAGIRRIGSAALDLCYVACGRFDAFWEHNLQPYDVAAGIVLVREAGGTVTRIDGRKELLPSVDILAGSPSAYEPVKQLLTTG